MPVPILLYKQSKPIAFGEFDNPKLHYRKLVSVKIKSDKETTVALYEESHVRHLENQIAELLRVTERLRSQITPKTETAKVFLAEVDCVISTIITDKLLNKVISIK